MQRIFLLLSLFLATSSYSKSNNHIARQGTYLYILDKKVDESISQYYVEEIQEDKKNNPKRYWLKFVKQNPVLELYDNSWFDRFLKPVADFDKARVARVVRDTPVIINQIYYHQIKDHPQLYTYYPNNEMVPRSNMNVVQKANDFNQCQPSKKPPLRKNGKPCKDRGKAFQLPEFMWAEIVASLIEDPELKHYYKNGIITPPMVAAAAHLETRLNPLLENKEEKDLCHKGQCTPYKWGKGIGQIGDSESKKLWNIDWQAPQNHSHAFVRNFEKISRRLVGTCGVQPHLSTRCIKKFKEHNKNCRKYESYNNGTSHAFCFKPAFKMFAKKMLNAFSGQTSVWQEYIKDKNIHIRSKTIAEILHETAKGNKKLWFAMSARLRAGYINRGAMVNLSLQECINNPNDIPCSYGNLNNSISRRPASKTSLGTPPKHLGAQILKGEFINRCHIWYFAGLCGEIREDSLLDQYTRIFKRDMGPLPQANPQSI